MEYKSKTISLEGNKKLINLCKKNNLETYNPRGKWNGYGYDKLPMAVKINSLKEMRLFNKLKRTLDGEPEKKELTEEERIKKWATRLSKLSELDIEECIEIANEKIEYKEIKVNQVEDRQSSGYSIERQKLINKMKRENPLRYIKNKEHAYAIISASERHSLTRYDNYLEEARGYAKNGDIDYEDIKSIARYKAAREK